MKRLVILGRGISGLMAAARMTMLMSELEITIIDRSTEMVEHVFHLHRPIEEFHSLSSQSGIKMMKFVSSIFDGVNIKSQPTIEDINNYSYKVFGHLKINNGGNSSEFTIFPADKHKVAQALSIAKYNFITGEIHSIHISNKVVYLNGGSKAIEYDYLISTIPLPVLLKLCDVKTGIAFESFPFYGATISIKDTGCYQQLISSTSMNSVTRITLMNDILFIESKDNKLCQEDARLILQAFGITVHPEEVTFYIINPGRITPLPSNVRKPLLHWLTEKHDIMTLGRYGAWTYKVANDVWDDTKFLANIIYAKYQSNKFEGGEND